MPTIAKMTDVEMVAFCDIVRERAAVVTQILEAIKISEETGNVYYFD